MSYKVIDQKDGFVLISGTSEKTFLKSSYLTLKNNKWKHYVSEKRVMIVAQTIRTH